MLSVRRCEIGVVVAVIIVVCGVVVVVVVVVAVIVKLTVLARCYSYTFHSRKSLQKLINNISKIISID